MCFKRKKKTKEREYDYSMAELKEKGISLFDLMVYHMKEDGYIDKDGNIPYPSD